LLDIFSTLLGGFLSSGREIWIVANVVSLVEITVAETKRAGTGTVDDVVEVFDVPVSEFFFGDLWICDLEMKGQSMWLVRRRIEDAYIQANKYDSGEAIK
jgi:hypothetical protein